LYHNASGWKANETNSSVNSGQQDNFTITLDDGAYAWNVWCNDREENSAFNATNYTVNVDLTNPTISFAGGTEDNNTYFKRDWIYVNVTAEDTNEANITFYLYNSSLDNINTTNLTAGNRNINFTNLNPDMTYYYNATITDYANNKNSTETRIITLDNSGPVSVLDRAQNSTNISTNQYMINASVTDNGIGVNVTTFLYRQNSTSEWQPACSDSDGNEPFNCTWDLTDLPEGNYYQIRVYANDSLGNIGDNDTHYNITIDKTAPIINLISPENNTRSLYGDVLFTYNVSDITSGIVNCSLIINEKINQSNLSITEDATQNFTLNDMPEAPYNWSVNCTDSAGNTNSSGIRNLTVEPDKDPPIVTLIAPPNNSTYTSKNVIFQYNVTDVLEGIANCSLIFEGKFNQTNSTAIIEGQTNTFTIGNLADGNYSWSVNCTDNSTGYYNTGNSSTWNFTLRETTAIVVNVSTDKTRYEQGEVNYITTNTSDVFNNKLDSNVTTYIIKGNVTLPWWNSSYLYRQRINISNNGTKTLLANYTVNYTIDTEPLVEKGKMQADGEDLRIAWWNNDSNAWQELDRLVFGINTTTTSVWFKTQRNISANESDVRYYVYYGNSTVTNPPENRSNIYFYFDGFDTDTLSEYNTTRAFSDLIEDDDSTLSHNESGWINYSASGNTGKSIRKDAPAIDDMVIEAQQYVKSWNGLNAKLELGTRVNGDVNYYFFASTNQNPSELRRNNGTDDVQLATSSETYTTLDVWRRLKLIVYNNDSNVVLKAFVDGINIINYTDTSTANISEAGGFGMGAYRLLGRWDNLSVRRYAEQSPLTYNGSEEELITENSSITGSDGSWTWNWSTFNISTGWYTVASLASKATYNNGAGYAQFEIVPDTTEPSVVLNIPGNGTSEKTENVTLYYTPSDNALIIENCSLIFGGLLNQTNSSITNNEQNNFTIISLEEGTYNWSVNCTDYVGNMNNSETWFFNIDKTEPSVNLTTPIDGYNTTNSTVEFNFTATDNFDINISCNLTIDGIVNQSNFKAENGSITNRTVIGISDGMHSWNVSCWDNATNINWSITRNFTVDGTAPAIVLNLPVRGDNTSNDTINFNWTATDSVDNNLTCNLTIDGAVNASNISSLNGTPTNYSVSRFDGGTHFWNISCWDDFNNTKVSETRNFTVVEAPTNLTAKLNNDNVSIDLNWTTVSYADSYEIYMTDNYSTGFQSAPNVSDVTDTNWTDSNANDSRQRFYQVAAVKGNARKITVLTVGKHYINLNKSWNLISLPFKLSNWELDNGTNEGYKLEVQPHDCIVSLWRYNVSVGWERTDYVNESWKPATGDENFTYLEAGRSYWAETNQSCGLIFVGEVPTENVTVSLSVGWNLHGWYSTNISELPTYGEPPAYPLEVEPANSITDIDRYNSVTGKWELTVHYKEWGWWPGWGFDNFTYLEPTVGYYFAVDQTANWEHRPNT
jgi:hypothetical protein